MDDDEKILDEILNTEKENLIEVLDAFGNLFINNEFVKDVPVLKHICSIMGLVREYKRFNFYEKIGNFYKKPS
ncbi:MAG: hypothetical protein K6D97_02895 [Clostridia bacterium]|nr:hypothetical protein [Clostridia bacterium]